MSDPVTDWQIGWKIALAYCDDDLKTIRFAPVHQNGIIEAYGVDAVAECQQWVSHKPPAEGCHCGFNAWHDRSMNPRYQSSAATSHVRSAGNNGAIVELRVGLYGDVVEGTLWRDSIGDVWGYQASRQRVADIFFDQRCYQCGDIAVELGLVQLDYVFGWTLHPVCSHHALDQVGAAFDYFMRHNSVDIHWKTSE